MEKTLIACPDNIPLSIFSFAPLLKYLQEKTFSTPDYRFIEGIISNSRLTLTLTGPTAFDQHENLVKAIMQLAVSTLPGHLDCWAITAPFSNRISYCSEGFNRNISSGKYIHDQAPDFFPISVETSYQLILKKFYGVDSVLNNTLIYKGKDKDSGLDHFTEFEVVTDFIDITATGILPELNIADLSKYLSGARDTCLLQDALPLHLFSIEGIVLVKARDVTTRECIAKINTILLTMPCFEDLVAVQNLQEQVQHLIQLPQAIISLASFRKTRKGTTEYELEDSKSLLLQPVCFIQEDSEVCELMKVLFESRTSLAVTSLPGTLLSRFPFLQDYADKGVTSLALFPLKIRNELVGIFSIVTCTGAGILQHHVEKAEALIPLLVLALSKQYEKISDEIDRVIKEQFTAVQSSVNWKFTEAARNYIRKKNKGEPGEIETIVFEKVFPLYGSIDVRNSSVERTRAIQKDLLEHLHLAENIIEKCTREFYLFSLKEIGFRLKKFISIASKVLFPGDELTIQNFLDEEITGLFKHLKKTVPGISDEVDHYFDLLHANTRKLSSQCAAFEESMAMINSELVKFVNQEQARVQEIYAHYFEYFISDGLDFNIYIGQSITPDKPFDEFYLKNLKLWQLTTLVKSARLVKDLQGAIPVPLETTQLILAHSKPLSISFRVGERKFDVDGAYNMHYEIIKKRIDKIKIMGSCERLTQPGKIAIVFAHDKEAQEYSSYIEFLQSEGLLEKEIEYFDLEELPGVRGLKALRVGIKMGLVAGACPAINDSYPLQAAV